MRVDTGRTRVEEAQLARSILATIAADVRATTIYQTQDISTIANSPPERQSSTSTTSTRLGTFTGSALWQHAAAPGTAQTPWERSSSTLHPSGGSSSDGIDGTETTTTMVPGLNGLVNELMLDVTRLPRLDELFPTVPRQASAVDNGRGSSKLPRPSDLKTVRYFVRQGTTIDPSDIAADVALHARSAAAASAGWCGKRSTARSAQTAEQAGNSQLLNSGQVLLAPEVTQIQFRYFDGTTAVDKWDMQEHGAMPTAVEVRIWLDPAGDRGRIDIRHDAGGDRRTCTAKRSTCRWRSRPVRRPRRARLGRRVIGRPKMSGRNDGQGTGGFGAWTSADRTMTMQLRSTVATSLSLARACCCSR